MGKGRKNTYLTQFLIWSGVILGILDWVTDAIYNLKAMFVGSGLKAVCVIFMLVQPLAYVAIFLKFVSTRKDIKTAQERREKMCFGFSYAFLQQFKLMGSFEYFNNDVSEKFAGDENAKAEFLNLENSYIVQILGELLLQTIPQIAIQFLNN